jgi:uncharacterized protein (UPF0548 family)
MPSGYQHGFYGIEIGKGEGAFERAKAALRSWQAITMSGRLLPPGIRR